MTGIKMFLDGTQTIVVFDNMTDVENKKLQESLGTIMDTITNLVPLEEQKPNVPEPKQMTPKTPVPQRKEKTIIDNKITELLLDNAKQKEIGLENTLITIARLQNRDESTIEKIMGMSHEKKLECYKKIRAIYLLKKN